VSAIALAIDLAEAGWLPDPVLRWGIRRACGDRLRREARLRRGLSDREVTESFLQQVAASPIAVVPDLANAQHYAVPAAFFQQVLGPRLKYSCAWWGDGTTTLADAEVLALDRTIAHADLADGMRILELGCGWGSLTLEMAARFPASSIVAVSNSASQRRFIEAEARRRRLANVVVETADINAYEPRGTFDRIVSVEMLEHVRNHQALFARLARWLRPDGRLFVHVFCHRRFAYTFDAAGAADWMARHFFSGGLMPSVGLLPAVPSRFRLEATWRWDGLHYARTANAWLANLDGAVDDLGTLLAPDPVEASRALRRWRLFFLACAELFATRGGEEWGVAHYRFAPEHTEGR